MRGSRAFGAWYKHVNGDVLHGSRDSTLTAVQSACDFSLTHAAIECSDSITNLHVSELLPFYFGVHITVVGGEVGG